MPAGEKIYDGVSDNKYLISEFFFFVILLDSRNVVVHKKALWCRLSTDRKANPEVSFEAWPRFPLNS